MHLTMLVSPSRGPSPAYACLQCPVVRCPQQALLCVWVPWKRGQLAAEAPNSYHSSCPTNQQLRPLSEGKFPTRLGMNVCGQWWEQGWGQRLSFCAPLSSCLCMLSQLLVSEEELIAPKPRTPEPRDQEGKREMLELVTRMTLEQMYEALDGREGVGAGCETSLVLGWDASGAGTAGGQEYIPEPQQPLQQAQLVCVGLAQGHVWVCG